MKKNTITEFKLDREMLNVPNAFFTPNIITEVTDECICIVPPSYVKILYSFTTLTYLVLLAAACASVIAVISGVFVGWWSIVLMPLLASLLIWLVFWGLLSSLKILLSALFCRKIIFSRKDGTITHVRRGRTPSVNLYNDAISIIGERGSGRSDRATASKQLLKLMY